MIKQCRSSIWNYFTATSILRNSSSIYFCQGNLNDGEPFLADSFFWWVASSYHISSAWVWNLLAALWNSSDTCGTSRSNWSWYFFLRWSLLKWARRALSFSCWSRHCSSSSSSLALPPPWNGFKSIRPMCSAVETRRGFCLTCTNASLTLPSNSNVAKITNQPGRDFMVTKHWTYSFSYLCA